MPWRGSVLAFDSSSIIYAWDNYPIEHFPPVWNWLSREMHDQSISFSAIVPEEVERNSPECWDWLAEQPPLLLPISGAILMEALRIKNLLGIIEDQYGAGVGENDLIIIATSRLSSLTLVTDESRQPTPPTKDSNRRIPSVCLLPSVGVTTNNFLEYLRSSGQVFQ